MTISSLPRRLFLGGGAVAAATVLTSCGSGSSDGGASGSASASSESSASADAVASSGSYSTVLEGTTPLVVPAPVSTSGAELSVGEGATVTISEKFTPLGKNGAYSWWESTTQFAGFQAEFLDEIDDSVNDVRASARTRWYNARDEVGEVSDLMEIEWPGAAGDVAFAWTWTAQYDAADFEEGEVGAITTDAIALYADTSNYKTVYLRAWAPTGTLQDGIGLAALQSLVFS